MMDYYQAVDFVNETMKERGISQNRLARNIGRKHNTMNLWLNKKNPMRAIDLFKILHYFGFDMQIVPMEKSNEDMVSK